MKRFLSLLSCLILFQMFGFSQAQRVVLIEEFTNASCGPCASQNPAFNTLLRGNLDRVVAIKYQTEFPGYDPMYDHNPGEIDTRQDYYGSDITGVPTAVIDGVVPTDSYAAGLGDWDIAGGGYQGGPYGYNQAVLTFAGAQTTPISMQLDHNIHANLDSIDISVKIKNESVVPFSPSLGVLHVGILEWEVNFPTAPGSNGETEFSDVMRKMVPNAGGTGVNMIAGNDSVSYNWTVPLPEYIYNYNEINVVAWVQDNSNKEVYQAARSDVKALVGDYADAGLASNTSAPAGLCEPNFTPALVISNEGSAEITSFDASYILNGGTPVTESWTGSLMSGASLNFDFPETTSAGGTTVLNYSITNVNGSRDVNSLNNNLPDETFATLSATPIGQELISDVELDELFEYPTSALAFPPIPPGEFGWGTFTVADPDHPFFDGGAMGGYGNSQKSIWLNFWQWNPAEPVANPEGSIIYDKLDFTGLGDVELTFDRAGAQYNAPVTNDRLQILVSTDCGDNWTIVHDIAGDEFATVAPTDVAFDPGENTWATDTVDLSAYDGVPEIIIQLKAISDWGNHHFVDNVNVLAGTISSNNEVNLLEGKVNVFPNPTTDVANIEFELDEASIVDIKVYDISGKLVQTLVSQREFIAGKHISTWQGTKDRGLYLVKISTELGEITKKLSVF